jgi:HAD superfamily hydrolase (TIGR01509 family)
VVKSLSLFFLLFIPFVVNPPALTLPPPGDFAGYIFDCDGTLAASMRLHYHAWVRALAHHRAKLDFTWEMFISHAGRGPRHFVALLNQLHGETLDPDRVARTQDQLLAELHHTIQPVPEVVALAQQLHAARKPLAVASGGNRPTVHRTLDLLNLRHLFPVIVTIEDVPHGKPAPDSFLLAAKLLNVPAPLCLVLGDSLLDIQAASAAGMASLKLDPQ